MKPDCVLYSAGVVGLISYVLSPVLCPSSIFQLSTTTSEVKRHIHIISSVISTLRTACRFEKMESVTLSDGTSATALTLASQHAVSGCCTVEGNVWLVSPGDRYVSVRNAVSGAHHSRVDLMTDDATAIAKVGPRVWVATASGKLLIFGTDGILIGVLQATAIPRVTAFHPLGDRSVVTTGGSKDFHLWDMSQFVVERTFLGHTPGEVVTCVVAADATNSSVIAVSTSTVRLWLLDGTQLAEFNEGGTSAVCLPAVSVAAEDASQQVMVWVAQAGWITVLSLPTARRATHFKREKTIPCALVQRLFSIDPSQVGAFDTEGLLTVWNTSTLLPMRSFKVNAYLDAPTPLNAETAFCFPTVERRTVSMWVVGGRGALLWEDSLSTDMNPSSNGNGSAQTTLDMEREEVRFLRRKLKYLESMATLYRQKVGVLFRERGVFSSGSQSPNGRAGGGASSSTAQIQAFNEIDATFSKALERWEQETKSEEPLLDPTAQVAAIAATDTLDFTEYWKRKYYEMVEEFSKVRQDHESLIDMINDEHASRSAANEGATGSAAVTVQTREGAMTTVDGRRAMFLTRVIREKNDLRERVMQLSDDVMKLRGLLKNQALGISGTDSSLDAIDALRLESQELRKDLLSSRAQLEQALAAAADHQQVLKQNLLLKQRVKKMRAELDIAQMQLSDSTANMQHDYHKLLDSIALLEGRLQAQHNQARDFDLYSAKMDLEVTSLKASLAQHQQLNEALQKELEQRERVEQNSLEHLQKELTLMCQSLDDRDARVAELLQQNNALVDRMQELEAASKHLGSTIAAKDQEIFLLHDRLTTVESVVQDRKMYAKVVDELQGRMEMVVEELRHGFKPVQFAANLSELEGRISNLFALESQLRQKDDIIAMRDDEISLLKEHIVAVEQQVQQVSTVFAKLPRSVEEVEQLLVEVDEYRRRLGEDADVQELIQLRLLELSARRQVSSVTPFVLQLSSAPLQPS